MDDHILYQNQDMSKEKKKVLRGFIKKQKKKRGEERNKSNGSGKRNLPD